MFEVASLKASPKKPPR